ncbi:MAG: tetratricopeptide repeat protein [Flavobacteriaceae bacterium]
MKRIVFGILVYTVFKVTAQSPPTGKQASASAVADSLYMTGNFIRAINKYSEVGDQKSNLQIARAYNVIGNYDKAIIQYEGLVNTDATLQISRFELGKLYHKLKRYDEARKVFTLLVSDDGNNPEYLYYQGEALRELDQIAGSLVAYKNAVAVDSTHLKSLFRLGKYFVIMQEKNEALRYIDKGLRFYENDVSLINLKALALFNNDEYDKALPLFERLLELGEKKEHIYDKLATCYFKTWQFEKAKSTYHTLIKIDDTNADPYFNLANVFIKDQQMDSAKFYLNRSIEVQQPNFKREYLSLAIIAREREDLNSAFKYYKLAYEEEPTDFTIFYQICALADQLFKDPKMKLANYENFITKFGTDKTFFSEMAQRRISELKEEIHFKGN